MTMSNRIKSLRSLAEVDILMIAGAAAPLAATRQLATNVGVYGFTPDALPGQLFVTLITIILLVVVS